MRAKNYDVIHDSFVEATNGKVIISEEEEEYYFKMGNRLLKKKYKKFERIQAVMI